MGNTRSRSESRFRSCRRLIRWCVAVAACAAYAACDSATAPNGSTEFYELRLIGGSPVPGPVPSSTGFQASAGGGLVLRANHTFAMVVDYPLPTFVEGSSSSQVAGDSRQISMTYPVSDTTTKTIRGSLKGDSLALDVLISFYYGIVDTVRWTFVRSSLPPVSVTTGTYALTEVVKAPRTPGGGVVRYDTTIAGVRYVGRILYDTIQFTDGVLFRRNRWEIDSSIYANGTSNFASEAYTKHGVYTGAATWLKLTAYGLTGTTRDSLNVGSGTLTNIRPAYLTEIYSRQ